MENPIVSAAVAVEASAPVYFQDPDGKPFYSLTPKKAADGRDWRGVPATADVTFDEPEQPAEIMNGSNASFPFRSLRSCLLSSSFGRCERRRRPICSSQARSAVSLQAASVRSVTPYTAPMTRCPLSRFGMAERSCCARSQAHSWARDCCDGDTRNPSIHVGVSL
jgi:hypothetical protein